MSKLTDIIKPAVRERNIVGLTGGGATKLDGIATVGMALSPIPFVMFSLGGAIQAYILRAGVDAEASPTIIRPDDFNAGTNAKVWELVANMASFPMLAPDGSSVAPSYSFAGDTLTGIFRDGGGDLAFTVGGNDILTLRDNGSGDSDVVFGAGAQLRVVPGTDQPAGEATLVAGTVTVTNTRVTAACIVLLTRRVAGGTIGDLTYTRAAGSFTINSSNALDTSTVSYLIIKLAA